MTSVTCQIAMSLDGYIAGPNQSLENPLGERGESLHDWAIELEVWRAQHGKDGGEVSVSSQVLAEATADIGAVIMGRRMFGGGDGPWDESWKGWWGEEPPFHGPVFVLTHHPREPLTLGDTTFTFVTEGIESALEQARAAAGDRKVAIGGGASTIQQYLAAGHLDELYLHTVPVFLGGGTPLFANVGAPRLEPVDVVAAPAVTHVKYRVRNRG